MEFPSEKLKRGIYKAIDDIRKEYEFGGMMSLSLGDVYKRVHKNAVYINRNEVRDIIKNIKINKESRSTSVFDKTSAKSTVFRGHTEDWDIFYANHNLNIFKHF